MKIMKIGLKWVHMARYGVILRLVRALWHTIISGPLRTPKRGAAPVEEAVLEMCAWSRFAIYI